MISPSTTDVYRRFREPCCLYHLPL